MTPMTTTPLKTRRPTGMPSWPIILIAGAEKAGKSWSCAQASSSDLIGRTLWLGMGEDDPDEYANIPGADFEIVEHDGTYRGFLNALTAAVAEPRVDGKPTLIVVDSMTRVWNVLTDMAQETANERARRKGKATDEADISMDLWNVAKQRWAHIMDTLRDHDGPVLLTARLDEVTVMQGGKPTTDKVLKVQAEKSLPYDVGAVVEMPERGKTFLKGVRSARLQLPERQQWNAFTVDEFWRKLGLAEVATAPRTHPKPAANVAPDFAGLEYGDLIDSATTLDEVRAIWKQIGDAGQLTDEWSTRLSARAEAIKAQTTEGQPEPGMASRGDLTQLSKLLGQLGITARQDCLDFISHAIARPIGSRKELTAAEVAQVINECRRHLGEAREQQGA